MPSTKTDVIINGAGPTGLALACQFVRYGVDFIIIDKKEGVTPYSKALGVHARTLEIYEQIDLAKPAMTQGTPAGKVRMLERGEVLGEVNLSNVGEGLSAYPFMLVFEQSRNEQLMYDWLRAHDRDVRWQTELVSFSQNDASVSASVKNAQGNTETIEASYVVGCDGPHSLVRHGLGLSFAGSTFERMFYVTDVHIDWQFTHDALTVCIAPHSVVAFFPMPGEKRWRIVGSFPEGVMKNESDVVYEEIEEQIKKEAQIDLDITRVDWFSTYKVHTRHVDRFSKGRCFVAGDAAHIHTPAGGQGMNTGIQDGYNLAWKLAMVLKHSAHESLLDSYNEERLPNAKRLTQTTDRMFNLAAGNDWFINLIRNTVFPPMAKYILSIDAIRKRFFIMISQIGISYRDSSLSSHDEDDDFDVKAGDRMPYFVIDGQSIFDKLRNPKFHLVTFSDGQTNPTQLQSTDTLDTETIALCPQVAELFGTKESFSVLLRPDNHIALMTRDATLKSVTEYLEKIFGSYLEKVSTTSR
jgi:2-polyprenyl-6-methoxyphenol hydroxylase-like FAD-dependent oxidoreductase